MKNSSTTRRLTTTVLANGIVIDIRIKSWELELARATAGRPIRSSLLTKPISNEIKRRSATTNRVNNSLIERSHKPNLKFRWFVMIFNGTKQPPSVGHLDSHSWTKMWERFRHD